MRNCLNCKKDISSLRSDAKYCNPSCRSTASTARNKKPLGSVINPEPQPQHYAQQTHSGTPSSVPGYLYNEKTEQIKELKIKRDALAKESKEWERKYNDLLREKEVSEARRDAEYNAKPSALGSISEGLATPEGMAAAASVLKELVGLIKPNPIQSLGASTTIPTGDPIKQQFINQLSNAVLNTADNNTLDKAATLFAAFIQPGYANWLESAYTQLLASMQGQQN